MFTFKQFLLEKKLEKIVVFTFGRFNPPTIGHAKLLKKVQDVAKLNNAISQIYPSKTQDNKRNPLKFDEKVKFLKKMFPDSNIIKDKNIKNPFNVFEKLDNDRVDKVIMIVGSDRVDEFKKNIKLDKFNHIKSVEVISAGERDPDSAGIEGASGTKQREFVRNNNFDQFIKGLPKINKKLARELFNALKRNLI